jgi:O-antigen ligase
LSAVSPRDDHASLPVNRRLLIPHAGLKRGTLWLLGASSGFALIEPSPYEIVFLLAVFVFALTGLRLSQKLLPMALLLLLYNIGGAISLIPWMDEAASVRFSAVSLYLMITSIFLAAIMAEDAVARIETLIRGSFIAAWCASIAAILGYFDIAGLGSVFTLYGRASGTFKDPNVLGPFLVVPLVFVLQQVLIGRRGLVSGFLLMSVPLVALLLTFSRGAWGNFVASAALMVLLTFLTAPGASRRARIVLLTFVAILMLALALLVALSFEEIRSVFEVRASLSQSYDVGVTGRFGNQIRSIPLLLDLPNGFGPLRFRFHFVEDPHNVYINAFASYGWVGGFAWLGLMAATCYVGWRLVFQRTPWQTHAVALWSILFVTILQGIQIDTDHWRHVYLLLGLVWGLAALAPPLSARPGSTPRGSAPPRPRPGTAPGASA